MSGVCVLCRWTEESTEKDTARRSSMLGDKTSDLWFFATIQTSRWLTSSKNLHHDSEVNNDTTFAING